MNAQGWNINAQRRVSALTIEREHRQLMTLLLLKESCCACVMRSVIGMEETGTASGDAPKAHVHLHHDKGLLAIGLFKLVEAVFFLLVGVGALHYIHRDLGEAALTLAAKLKVDPEGRLVGFVLDHLDSITAHRLRQIGVATFCYAGLRVTEGVGLVLEKVWAEYLTVGVTVSFLPWEMYEIARRLDWFRVGLFVVNLMVLAYLIWWLRRRKRVKVEVGG
jgi:uncharacterized membrane protein (DUF2068 family)